MKKWIVAALLAANILTTASKAEAVEYVTDTGGCGYEDCCRSICIIPAIGFAALMIAGIIAVGVHNRSSSGHGHSHSE